MLFGFIILGFGVLFLLESVIPEFAINYSLVWPIVIMLVAVYHIFKEKRLSFWNSLLFIFGTWSLLVNMDLITDSYRRLLFPIILIMIGISVIYNAMTFSKAKKNFSKLDTEGIINYYGIFAGVEEKVTDKEFKGANIYSIFGGSDLDFSNIELKSDNVIITCYSIFGGSEIKLPKDYNVIFSSVGIFGGNENKYNGENISGKKTIHLNCVSIFGGTEIR